MNYRLDDYVHDGTPPRRWLSPLVWTVLVVGGWLIYEATAQPALAVAAVCLKFGWNDLRTGIWLARRDPDRRRGPACFWLFLGMGLWKSGLTAVFFLFALPMAIEWPARRQAQVPQGRPFEAFLAASLVGIASFSLSCLPGAVAFYLGWRGRLKLWAEPNVHQARRRNLWPPTLVTSGRRNWAVALFITSLIVLLAPVGVLVAIAFQKLAAYFDAKPDTTVLVMAEAVVAWLFAVLLLWLLIGRFVVAKSPLECWNESAPGPENSQPHTA